jgi:polyisoprenoid-binding protein YceI
MRILLFLPLCALAACISIGGSDDRPAPFSAPPPTEAPAADYPVAVDLPAGSYRLDPRHSSVVFRIRHMDLAWFTARFDDRLATLQLDPADPSRSSLTASVAADSVNTGVLGDDGARNFDQAIGRAIGGETTPRITFVSTRIERTGEFTARLSGDLTMNGQTHPVTLNATFAGGRVDPLRGGAMVLGFSAYGEFNRSDWGVTQWGAFTGDAVQVVIEAEFIRS